MSNKKLLTNDSGVNTKEESFYQKRSVGIQSIVPFKEQINPKIAASFQLEEEEYPKFVTLPYTITSMILTMAIIFYTAFYYKTNNDSVLSVNYNALTKEQEEQLFGVIFFFLKLILAVIVILGVTYFPDSIMRRPHPIFWRIVYSAGLFYLLIILFISILSRDDARYFMKVFDSKLNSQLEYKSYGENCPLSTNEFPYFNLKPILDSSDIYIVAHLLGWFVKYIAIRSFWLSNFLSLLFELLELTFKHWLPNFIECWWDHLFLDFLGMNLLGIALGFLVCRYCNMKKYRWLNNNPIKNTIVENENNKELAYNVEKNKLNKSAKQEIKRRFSEAKDKLINTEKQLMKYFTPTEVVIYEWDVFSSSWRFFTVLWFVATVCFVDLSHFFLKTLLWLPITHWTLAFRIFLWGFMCIMASREYYEYVTNPACKRLGHFIWLSQVILFTEWMIIIKFGDGIFTAPFPDTVVYCWTAAAVVIAVIATRLIIKDLIKYFTQKKLNEESSREQVVLEYHD